MDTLELELFRTTKPNVNQLRKRHSRYRGFFYGEFADSANDYREFGLPIVSWNLFQGKPKNPTYGMVSNEPCKQFNSSSYTEVITILEGTLEAEVNGVMGLYKPRGRKLIATPNSTLKLNVKRGPVLYFCQYI
ncbi:hypothetical protein HYT53_03380 [Candidatus Woesearchaeota archaeon]|nr:hypothetical protein [Candidatus Woesearchaeota archaeon]